MSQASWKCFMCRKKFEPFNGWLVKGARDGETVVLCPDLECRKAQVVMAFADRLLGKTPRRVDR